jgi:glyoxylase-like metal-dependent hydrolase (beta-lactamase superfamily II)
MAAQITVGGDATIAPDKSDGANEVMANLAYRRLAIANVVFLGSPDPDAGGWVLVDAGVLGTARLIKEAVENRFGARSRPNAILLTHGHFDHVGALEELAGEWDVPVYAHDLEMPYLDGRAAYPPPDPTVGGGMMAALSRFYPRGPVNVGRWLRSLPVGRVPTMPGWEWIHTPGHTPGHVSFWNPQTKTLIVGDAFITTNQESAFAVLVQSPELHGPPMYYTTDWENARASVRKLAALEPEVVVTGHGPAMRGPELRQALHKLARDFDMIAVPSEGRYVGDPAKADETGPTYVPPKKG